ncbi:hypothetical protein DL95DRAFT_381791 [Leptodontidium sp. 2 PMI_412]|nr:hypothetical protein DL95DRAFT_381791 [Leptodontidium sp. 2 PMI_412]
MATIARSSPLFVAPVPAVHQLPAQALPRPFLTTFASFPRLPTELQQEIWSVAIAVQYYMEKRFLRVAPDSESLERNDNDSEVAQIRIISDIHRRPRLVPSLLHACHYSRKEAIKGYELWGCADPVTYEANSAKVYVKVDIDSFFFGDADLGDFWALHTFINESEPDDATADDTARTKFIEQIGLIKHFTFDNELWNQRRFPRVPIQTCHLPKAIPEPPILTSTQFLSTRLCGSQTLTLAINSQWLFGTLTTSSSTRILRSPS